jgi:hypothetical protein
VTLTTDLVSRGVVASRAPLDVIPVQTTPHLTVSLTEGCEAPMEALRATSADRPIRCNPCDEAVVRLLMGRIRRADAALLVTSSISPGTLSFG